MTQAQSLVSIRPVQGRVTTALQIISLLLISLVVGSMFGIWRGYNPASFAPTTFVEVHQGAVRGLNILLPAMALVCILTVVALAWLGRGIPQSFWLYIAAALAMVAGGLITRFGNQPINAVIMTWGTVLPDGWQMIRDTWWNWHLARLGAGIAGELLLIAAIFTHRG
ncbi:DUF1772 domain-containing protein [Phaeovulum sp.]|uniref:DUF1772 domain-containing protein n=1 Tax=Phaeovulum sp. TaxID=2934796 RepID=UPI00272FD13A|nr:DUF1772 domain-containing protein [Phaeovulum sp.]MDP1667883.1 DUF1772 domain-containing protein [Phaeovulum sp.]MDZ4120460.1 DUF1772 domain-containing protein [Phaeovulum sp.]